MITPQMVVNHIAEYLPRINSSFCDNINLASVVCSGGDTLTCTTSTAHGFSVNDAVMFTGGKTPNNIVSVAEYGDNVLFELENEHDFTTPNNVIKSEPFPCVGFNESAWNTTLSIVEVPSKTSVVVEYPLGISVIPTFLNAIGYEERPLSIFGAQTITDVGSTTEFTVTLSNVPPIPNGIFVDVVANSGARVVAVDNFERANAIYADGNDGDLWLFVIMTDLDVSKDRNSFSDAVATFNIGGEMRLRMLQHFSTVVYFGTTDAISGASAQQLAYGDLFRDLLKVLYGFAGLSSEKDESDFATVFAGHGTGVSNTSYYTQVYDWETPLDITVNSGFDMYEDVAFRNLVLDFGMFTSDNEERLTIAVELEP